jgi:hypothetical protein
VQIKFSELLLFGPEAFVFYLLSKDTDIKMYRIIILLEALYGCETWCPALREEHESVLRNILTDYYDEVSGRSSRYRGEEKWSWLVC